MMRYCWGWMVRVCIDELFFFWRLWMRMGSLKLKFCVCYNFNYLIVYSILLCYFCYLYSMCFILRVYYRIELLEDIFMFIVKIKIG